MLSVFHSAESGTHYIGQHHLTVYPSGLVPLVLALLTKNIRHEHFKTKSVTFLVYFLTVTLSLGLPLYLILNTTHVSGVDLEYVVLSLTYLAVVFLCFFFLFFPPVLSLLRTMVFHKLRDSRNFQQMLVNFSSKSHRSSHSNSKTKELPLHLHRL